MHAWWSQTSSSVLGRSQPPAEVVGRRIVQPVCVHHAQVPHVALVGVKQPVVHHAGWLAVEEHGGGVDGHQLVRVHGAVGAVRLQLSGVHEEAVSQAAADVPGVPAGGLHWDRELVSSGREKMWLVTPYRAAQGPLTSHPVGPASKPGLQLQLMHHFLILLLKASTQKEGI